MEEKARQLFEAELQRRSVDFSIDSESNRYLVEKDGGKLWVCLDNIARELRGEGDEGRMAEFVDAVMVPRGTRKEHWRADQLYWILEPNDYEEKAGYREAISKQADRVLVHYDDDAGLISWVTPDMLNKLGLSEQEASAVATGNMGMELAAASLETSDMQGVTLGFLTSHLPFKASLMLAPNLKKVVGEKVGWPLLAVAPARDFLYLWPAEHGDFAGRVGKVVVREYQNSAYPISTEAFRIDDEGIEAIGAYPVEPPAPL
jgi:uncharacterized protein YtpQ (UPF0354 family)